MLWAVVVARIATAPATLGAHGRVPRHGLGQRARRRHNGRRVLQGERPEPMAAVSDQGPAARRMGGGGLSMGRTRACFTPGPASCASRLPPLYDGNADLSSPR